MVYMRAVELAGGLPVVLPPLGHDTIAPLLDRLDGVCLSGGPDLDPAGYGADERNPELGPTEPELDAFELALAQLADARGVPVLGICRGVAGAQRRARRHAAPARRRPRRRLDRAPAGRARARADAHGADRAGLAARRVMGVSEAEVNSFHHQAADRLGQDLRAVAWAPDGIVEGIESTGAALYLGVQWHAESLVERPEQLALFRELVEQAGAYASSGRSRRAA